MTILRERRAAGPNTQLEGVAGAFGLLLSDGARSRSDVETALDVVRSAGRGEISRDELVKILESWESEPTCRTRGLVDEWESRPNSFEAVEYAFIVDLIDEVEYQRIFQRTGRTSTS